MKAYEFFLIKILFKTKFYCSITLRVIDGITSAYSFGLSARFYKIDDTCNILDEASDKQMLFQ